ncbi:tetratricopeptide repeat protein [Endothiovibrio diazotrophicus]
MGPERTLTLDQALTEAADHHRRRCYPEAERLYRAILAHQPDHPVANHRLGTMAVELHRPVPGLPFLKAAVEAAPERQRYWADYAEGLIVSGEPDEALRLIEQMGSMKKKERAALRRRAETCKDALARMLHAPAQTPMAQRLASADAFIARYPGAPIGWAVRFDVQRALGARDEAYESARQLTLLNPDNPTAHTNLGVALWELGRREEAIEATRRATELAPADLAATTNLSALLLAAGRLDEAETSCRRALEIDPAAAAAHLRLGDVLNANDRFDEALACYERAIALAPQLVEAIVNRALLLASLGRLDEAEAAYRQALTLAPEAVEIHNNLGTLHFVRGHMADAESAYRRALEIAPGQTKALRNLGNTYRTMHRLDDAEACYRQALQGTPNDGENLVGLGIALAEQGRAEEAATCYRRALELDPDDAEAHSSLLFTLDAAPRLAPPRARYAEALAFAARARRRATPFTRWPAPRDPDRTLHVGLISGDLRNHPVGHFLESILPHLATERLRLSAYPTRHCDDDLSRRIRPALSHWEPLHALSDRSAARLIHDHRIDLLIDLAGHTGHNRLPLFAWRAAPLQASWLGYSATTGMSEIDYYITDAVRLPPGDEAYYAERIWRLPETRLCFTPPQDAPAVAPLPALENGHVTFGCFQNLIKVGDEVLILWSRILQALPGARLRIQSKPLADTAARQRLEQRLRDHGIDPRRVAMHPAEGRAAYLEAHREVDLILDTFPYPGGTTTCEALWMGVPTLTLAGETETSRNGASQLACAGLSEWIAHSEREYVEKAVAAAEAPERLAALRAELRGRAAASPLFDAPRFAGHFEQALREMWRRYCAQGE